MAITVERLQAEVDADPSGAVAGLTVFDRRLDASARDRTATITVDADTNTAEAALQNLGRSADRNRASFEALGVTSYSTSRGLQFFGGVLGGIKFGAVYTGLSMVTGGLQALAGAAAGAVSAVAPLGGLLATLPAGFGAVAGGAGSAIAGFVGIGDAMKAQAKIATAGTGVLAEQSSAIRNVASAQRSLKNATDAVADAQKDLAKVQAEAAKAPRQAREDLAQQRRDTAQAVLSEEQAVLALKDAQERLAGVQDKTAKTSNTITKAIDEFTGKTYETVSITADAADAAEDSAKASLAVRQAELDLANAKANTAKQSEELTRVEKNGIKNSDAVVQANDRVAQAQDRLRGAMDAVSASQDGLAAAQKRASVAAMGGAQNVDKYNEAMKKLTPEGRTFVKFLQNEFMPGLGAIRRASQSALLPGIQDGLTSLMDYFPRLRKHVVSFNRITGRSFAGLMAHLFDGGEGAEAFDKAMGNLVQTWGELTDLGVPLVDSVVNLLNAAQPLTNSVLKGLNRELSTFADWSDSIAGKASLTRFFDIANQRGGEWWETTKNLSSAFGGLFTAMQPFTDWMMQAFIDNTQELADAANSIDGQKGMKAFFEGIKPALQETSGLISDITKVLFDPALGGKDSAFVRTVEQMRLTLVPALEEMFAALNKSNFGPEFVEVISNLVDAITQLVEHDGALVQVAKAFNWFADSLRSLDKATSGGSTTVLTSLITALGVLKISKGLLRLVAPGVMANFATNLSRGAKPAGVMSRALRSMFGLSVARNAASIAASTAAIGAGGVPPVVPTAPGGTPVPGARPRIGTRGKVGLGVAAVGAVAVGGAAASGGKDGLTQVLGSKTAQGALYGAMIGSSVPVIGTAIGTAAGTAIGAILDARGYIGKKQEERRRQREDKRSDLTKNIDKATAPKPRKNPAFVGENTKLSDFKTRLKQAGDLKRAYEALPKQVQTAITTPGLLKSEADTKWLQDRYNLTPKQMATISKLTGIPEAGKKVDGWRRKLNEIPYSRTTRVYLDTTAAMKNALKLRLEAEKQIDLVVSTTNRDPGSVRGGGIPDYNAKPRASGGPVKAGEPYVVGERRPEMFVPTVSGRIAPKITNDMAGSRGGMTKEDVNAIIAAIEANERDIKVEQTFNEKVDPQHMGAELAWRLR